MEEEEPQVGGRRDRAKEEGFISFLGDGSVEKRNFGNGKWVL